MKGALVEFSPAFGASMPNVIVFQFNPETLRRTWTQPEAESDFGANPLGVHGTPGEAYALTLMLDITDELAGDPTSPGTIDAKAAGLGSRLSALEMLMFPVPSDGMMTDPTGGGAGPADGAGGTDSSTGGSSDTPAAQVPAVLFIWGAGRILPVRITALSITEKLFDTNLNPTQAEVELGFRVMTPEELESVTGPFKTIAVAAYNYSQTRRETLALFNLRNAAGAFDLPPIPGL